jgi:hypothetical protein
MSWSASRSFVLWGLGSALVAAVMVAFAIACGPPPDGYPGAGRSFTPPPVSTGGSGGGADTGPAAEDTSPPPPPKDTSTPDTNKD